MLGQRNQPDAEFNAEKLENIGLFGDFSQWTTNPVFPKSPSCPFKIPQPLL